MPCSRVTRCLFGAYPLRPSDSTMLAQPCRPNPPREDECVVPCDFWTVSLPEQRKTGACSTTVNSKACPTVAPHSSRSETGLSMTRGEHRLSLVQYHALIVSLCQVCMFFGRCPVPYDHQPWTGPLEIKQWKNKPRGTTPFAWKTSGKRGNMPGNGQKDGVSWRKGRSGTVCSTQFVKVSRALYPLPSEFCVQSTCLGRKGMAGFGPGRYTCCCLASKCGQQILQLLLAATSSTKEAVHLF